MKKLLEKIKNFFLGEEAKKEIKKEECKEETCACGNSAKVLSRQQRIRSDYRASEPRRKEELKRPIPNYPYDDNRNDPFYVHPIVGDGYTSSNHSFDDSSQNTDFGGGSGGGAGASSGWESGSSDSYSSDSGSSDSGSSSDGGSSDGGSSSSD